MCDLFSGFKPRRWWSDRCCQDLDAGVQSLALVTELAHQSASLLAGCLLLSALELGAEPEEGMAFAPWNFVFSFSSFLQSKLWLMPYVLRLDE